MPETEKQMEFAPPLFVGAFSGYSLHPATVSAMIS